VIVLAAGVCCGIAVPAIGPAAALAQDTQEPPPRRPAADDPFAEELNPFPKTDKPADGQGEKGTTGKSRTGQTPRGAPRGADRDGDDAAPRRPAVPRDGGEKGADAGPGMEGAGDDAPPARPRARTMAPGSDLLPFPDVGPTADEFDSPARAELERAEQLDREGRYAEAKKLILEAIEKDPKLPLAYLALGIVTRHMGDMRGSVEACSKGLRLDPTDPELALRRGIAWFYLGQRGIALEDFEDASGAAYDDPRPELWRGLTLMELERPLEAISAYSAAIRRDRTYDLAYLNRGLAYLASGEPAKAEADFDHAIRHDPRDARAWFNRGVAQARQGQYAEAVASYEEALRIDPAAEGARRNLAATRARARPQPAAGAVMVPAERVPAGRVVTPAPAAAD
jgi:Tfp pilus assembly protein PilF